MASCSTTIAAAPCWVPGKLELFYTSYRAVRPEIYLQNLRSGDRKRIATGSLDKSVRVWDSKGKLELPITGETGHQNQVLTVAFSPDNTKLVSLGGFGGSITIGFDHPVYNNPHNPFGVDLTARYYAVGAELGLPERLARQGLPDLCFIDLGEPEGMQLLAALRASPTAGRSSLIVPLASRPGSTGELSRTACPAASCTACCSGNGSNARNSPLVASSTTGEPRCR